MLRKRSSRATTASKLSLRFHQRQAARYLRALVLIRRSFRVSSSRGGRLRSNSSRVMVDGRSNSSMLSLVLRLVEGMVVVVQEEHSSSRLNSSSRVIWRIF